MTALALFFLACVVAGFILERRLMQRDMAAERRDWAIERGQLLDRIKPETSQPPLHGPDPEPFQPPVDDEEYWEAHQN